jgi:hypothetical protein
MSPLGFAAVTFVCTFTCAWLGTVGRSALPQAHVSKESQDVVRLGMGLVATMTALLLGLVTAAAKGSFDSTDTAIRNGAAAILTLDRILARYGPETKPTRDLLRTTVANRVEQTFAAGEGAPLAPSEATDIPAERIENQILALTPTTDTQRWLKAEALKLCLETLRTRWRLLGSSGGSVPRMFLGVVIFWLAMTFASFGLAAPRNATVITALGISAFSVAAAVFLILELDGPFTGIIQVSGAPLRYALTHIGQ